MQPDKATAILEFLLGTIEREHVTTAKVLAAVPAERSGYTPDERSMTALDLAWHIATAEMYFMNGVINGEFSRSGADRPERIKTPSDIAAWYQEQFAEAVAKLKQLSGDQLVRIISFNGVFSFSAIGYVQLMMNHSIHHRGQLSAYLRPMGAKVPSIYGPSADEGIPTATASA
jgi:uncharacterized damage-inducible protein DinB